MRRYLLALLLIGCSLLLSAQTMQQFIDDAELQHENQNYYGAYDSYRIATKFDESRMDLWYGQGENARLYTAYETALGAYNHVLLNATPGDFPELQFRIGQVHQFLGNYEEAAQAYEQYLSQTSAGQENREAAEKNLEDCRWAASRVLQADDIEVTHLPIAINSEFSDFGYRPNGDSSFFSSNRLLYEEDALSPPRYLSRIFRVMDGNPTDPGQLKHTILEEGKHMAHTSFNAAQNRAYYTICEYIGDTETVRCDLFFSAVDERGQWGPPMAMNINVVGANNTQPQVATDPLTGREMLYFASDRDGGMGGLDLYRAPLNEDGTAGTVENLSSVNTDGDDYTPFFDSQGCRLYFSTDGRNTLGGFDIYYATANGEFGEPVHLNHPVNGSFHDRYYIIAREDNKAYFSSNRQGEEAIRWPGEENACCDDIYSVPFKETVILDVFTFREIDNTDLDRATVQLFRVNEDGSRELVAEQTQPSSNQFTFEIEPGAKYELEGTRPAFGPDNETADLTVACEVPEDNRITRELFFPQQLIVNVFDEKTREPLNGARVRLANSEAEIDSPIADETKENSNRFEYIVRLDPPYYVHAERDAYMPNDSSFTIPEADVDENGVYEVDIFLRQPDPIDLVPVNLYFDNDRPHPSSRRVTSDIQYVTTNERYFARKDAFIEDLIKPEMSEEEQFLTREQLNDFFDNDVLGGRERLIELADLLLERLELGTTYEMTVEGNASKRGNPAYNQNLSQRRVDSVLDFFRQYRGGVLAPFIDSGALSFITSFAGDSNADPNDRSVFGLQASRSRRVTITDLKATN